MCVCFLIFSASWLRLSTFLFHMQVFSAQKRTCTLYVSSVLLSAFLTISHGVVFTRTSECVEIFYVRNFHLLCDYHHNCYEDTSPEKNTNVAFIRVYLSKFSFFCVPLVIFLGLLAMSK